MILIEPDHINKSLTVSRSQLHPFQLYIWRDSAIRAKTVLILICEDGAGQFHHGKATNRLGSTVISLSGISLAAMLTFLWVMHQNNGYNNNIFLCHGGKDCVRKQPSYMRNTSYFPGLLTNLR